MNYVSTIFFILVHSSKEYLIWYFGNDWVAKIILLKGNKVQWEGLKSDKNKFET